MLPRFAAGSLVASIVIALAALVTLVFVFPPDALRIMTTAWCIVPFAWGVWAMLAPASWMPQRLPLWGAILGVVVGVMVGPVLAMPARMGAPPAFRWVALVIAPVVYYALWMAVAAAWKALCPPAEERSATRAG
jgi:hypothetical protein